MPKRSTFALTSLAFGYAFLYVPILILIIFSFNENKLVTVWSGFSTKWYGQLIHNRQIIDAVWLSLKIAFMNACLAVVLGTLVALVLVRFGRFRGRALLSGMAAAPLVMRIKVKRKAEHAAVVDPAALVPLATTRELRQVLDDLRAADLPEVRAAWLEKFAATAKCPECSGPLRLRRTGLTSTCGWRLRF